MNRTIDFHTSIGFNLPTIESYRTWIDKVIQCMGYDYTEINYHFCSDDEVLSINLDYLSHHTYTDIITFDHSVYKVIQTDIYISIDRVEDNANKFKVNFETELRRVMIHGILHCCGYKDKTKEEKMQMRLLEDDCLKLFHVEH